MSKQTNKSLPANSTQIKKDGQTPAWLPIRTLSLLLAIISFAVYANTMQNGYVLDDATVITRNTIVTKGFSGIPEILVTPRLKGFEQSNDAGSYRPVPLILSAIEYQLFGANPSEGHLSNVLLFIGCVIALFLFLNRLLKNERTGIAFIAALLFALHPVHTEVVANIKSRDELMCFLFAFISLICFTRYARSGKIMQLLAGAGALLLSYLSKETVIAFIFLIPLVFFFYENENRKRSLFITASTAVITIGFLLVRAAVLGTNHTNAIVFLSNPLISAPDLLSRMASAILVIGMYLKLLFLPYPLICDYSYNSIPTVGFGNLFVLVSLAVILALTVTGIYRLVRRPKDPWAFGILFFLATLFLFSNIPFLIYSEIAERFLFFPSVGFCLAAALAYDRWIANTGTPLFAKNRKALAILWPVCILYSGLTFIRNADWKDNYTLFSTDLKKAPRNCELNYYMASELSLNMSSEAPPPTNQKELDQESIGYLNSALSIYPEFEAAHAALGTIYDRLCLFDSAIVHDKKAISLDPFNSIATYNLGRAYFFQKNYADGIKYFRKTIELKPGYIMGLLNLASCYTADKQYDSAIVYYNKTLAIDPTQQIAQKGLAIVKQMKSVADTSNNGNRYP